MRKRFKTFDFWDGCVFGSAISMVTCLFVILIMGSFSESYVDKVSRFVTAPISLIGIFFAFYIARYQINFQRTQDLFASSSMLPLALSEIIGVSNRAISIAAGLHANSALSYGEVQQEIHVSENSFDTIKDYIKFSDGPTREWLRLIVAKYQIYLARSPQLAGISGPTPNFHRFDDRQINAIVDWSTLKAICEHLLEFARAETDSADDRLNSERISEIARFETFSIGPCHALERRLAQRMRTLRSGEIHLFR